MSSVAISQEWKTLASLSNIEDRDSIVMVGRKGILAHEAAIDH